MVCSNWAPLIKHVNPRLIGHPSDGAGNKKFYSPTGWIYKSRLYILAVVVGENGHC